MDNIIIGKHTLESLTSGMYSDPYVVYREYVQNSVDSIDEAIETGLLKKGDENITIALSPSEGKVVIKDNGVGVQKEKVEQILISIGNSKKESRLSRGFRGIGRLAGLSYCQKLVFKTSFFGEGINTIMEVDAMKLSDLLSDKNENNQTITQVLSKVYVIRHEVEKKNTHYFEVELVGVDEKSNLLNAEEVERYLQQNLPLPFSPEFVWGKEIEKRIMLKNANIYSYNIYLQMGPEKVAVYKPYRDTFVVDKSKGLHDHIEDIEVLRFNDPNGKTTAVGWIAKTNFLGSIANKKVKGIRLRKGNIQIGDHQTLNIIYKDARFNGWTIGEIHVLDENLVPNARRDNFEKNEAYFILFEQLATTAASITKEIRACSTKRNSDLAKALDQSGKISKEANKALKKNISEKEKNELANELLSAQEVLKRAPTNNDSERINCNIAFDELDMLIGKLKGTTKYKAVNSIKSLTVAEKKLLERVIDTIFDSQLDDASKLVDEIINSVGKTTTKAF